MVIPKEDKIEMIGPPGRVVIRKIQQSVYEAKGYTVAPPVKDSKPKASSKGK